MNAHRQSGSNRTGLLQFNRQSEACVRRYVHGPIRPMETPGLLNRLFGIGG